MSQRQHFGWLDIARGLTIVLVVVLYANEWAQSEARADIWLQQLVEFAAPFRMPAFFLISGLLLSSTIARGWRTFLDGKVAHFAYFYVLWLTILVGFEAHWIAEKDGWREVVETYLTSLVHPYSMLWFIYLLPMFFVATKLLRGAPHAVVWTAAAALQIADPGTGIKVLDKFTPYYVFFYSGYALAPLVFRLAGLAAARRRATLAALAIWAALNASIVAAGVADAPAISLVLGLLGAGAMIAGCVWLESLRGAAALAYCGRHSLVIYLGFYIPLVIAGNLAYFGPIPPGVAAVAAAAAGVAAPLLLHRLVRDTRLAFLFERPAWFSLARRGARAAPAAFRA